MSRLECERWASLVDREALEGSLSRDDVSFQAEHARSCAACARELSAWCELRSLDPAQTPRLERDLLLEDTVLKKLWQEPRVPQAASIRSWSKRRLAVMAGSLAAAAAVAVFVLPSLRKDAPLNDSAVAHVTVGSGNALAEGGTLRRPGAVVRAGESLRAGESPMCLVIEPGVRACLAPGGELRLADAAVAHRRLELVRGRLVASLDPQPAGTTFSVSTRAAVVTAIGTIFSVEVTTGSEPVKVRVLRGVVKVRTNDAQERTLRAHQGLVLGIGAPVDVPASEETSDLALLRMDAVRMDAERADAETAPEAAHVASDALPAPSASAQQGVPAPAGERATPAVSEPLGPGELLRQALELRAQSRFADAARVYRKLVAAHPGSAEGRAALVSLGDLQLSRLQDAGAALRSFDAYLASGDRALKQEAEYGRIRAFRALRQPLDEQRAIERLLLSYPSGVHAEPMRARLQSLKGDAGR